jgi:hypothetical protein
MQAMAAARSRARGIAVVLLLASALSRIIDYPELQTINGY